MSRRIEHLSKVVRQSAVAVMLATLGGSCMAPNVSAQRVADPRETGVPRPTLAGQELGASTGEERFEWRNETFSPQPAAQTDAWLTELASACGRSDGALSSVATRAARHQARTQEALDVSVIGFALRAEGAPYVWPRVWSIEGALDREGVSQRMKNWLSSFDDGGERRCGVGMAQNDRGDRIITVIAADVLADLHPLPSQVEAGRWLDVDATLLGTAKQAKVVVLGPSGAPYAVPTTLSGNLARARVHADKPGTWVVQLLASGDAGPRPVLEAVVHVDQKPPAVFEPKAVPGEDAGAGAPDDRTALEWMVRSAREEENLPTLRRDSRLDAIAQAHAEAMQLARRVAHDVGDGDPGTRVQGAGLQVRTAGENVARALTLPRVHRALWASPSHRSNLLDRRFEALGIGIVRDADGTVWAAEVFADFR